VFILPVKTVEAFSFEEEAFSKTSKNKII